MLRSDRASGIEYVIITILSPLRENDLTTQHWSWEWTHLDPIDAPATDEGANGDRTIDWSKWTT